MTARPTTARIAADAATRLIIRPLRRSGFERSHSRGGRENFGAAMWPRRGQRLFAACGFRRRRPAGPCSPPRSSSARPKARPGISGAGAAAPRTRPLCGTLRSLFRSDSAGCQAPRFLPSTPGELLQSHQVVRHPSALERRQALRGDPERIVNREAQTLQAEVNRQDPHSSPILSSRYLPIFILCQMLSVNLAPITRPCAARSCEISRANSADEERREVSYFRSEAVAPAPICIRARAAWSRRLWRSCRRVSEVWRCLSTVASDNSPSCFWKASTDVFRQASRLARTWFAAPFSALVSAPAC